MSGAAGSMTVFGVYYAGIGLAFLTFPNPLLRLFGFPPTDEPWIRFVGLFVLILGYYFLRAARSGVEPFFRWTVHGRFLFAATCFVLFAASEPAPPAFLLFGTVDMLGAFWTLLALRPPRG